MLDEPIKVGQELCVRVRVRDLSGLWSEYRTSCVGRPVDDASLKALSGWRRVTVLVTTSGRSVRIDGLLLRRT